MLAQLDYVNLRAAVLFDSSQNGHVVNTRQRRSACGCLNDSPSQSDPASFWYTIASVFLRL